MKLTLHKLPEGYLITSDEKIEENDVVLNANKRIIKALKDYRDFEPLIKVIAQQDQIDFSDLKEEDQREIGWFDVEKLFAEKANIPYFPDDLKRTCKWWFEEGFQKAQELSDRMFTGKNIVEAIAFGFSICKQFDRAPFDKEQIKFIESLSQKSWNIEVEMEMIGHPHQYVNVPKFKEGKIKILKIL
jgi:hypothetical protein